MNTAVKTSKGGNVIQALKGKTDFSLLWIIHTSCVAHTASYTTCTGAYCTLSVTFVMGHLPLVVIQPEHAAEHST